jgi:protocatechuate 3,4-dioxygenase beta subunit
MEKFYPLSQPTSVPGANCLVNMISTRLTAVSGRSRKASFYVLLLTAFFSLASSIAQAQCTCPGNLVLNPSFENGTANWNWSGGTLSTGTGAVKCGSFSGDFQITNTTSNWVSQTIGTDLPAGTVINASVYAGTHNNSFNHDVSIMFFDASWNWLPASVHIEVDKVLANTPVGPQLYNWSATVPSGAKYTQVGFSGNGDWIKTDQWCVTSTPPATCNPNDGTAANGFCAPASNCTANASTFVWSQSINATNGSPSVVRLVGGSVNSYTIPVASYPAAFAGPVSINITDVVSYDGYAGRNTVTQTNERWRILFKKSGAVVHATGYTTDVPDLQNQGYWRGSLGSNINLPNGTDEIVIEHINVAGGTSGPGSVVPVSICLSYSSLLGSIGDRVWFDADGDGIQDASETGGITGITVQLKNSAGTVIATTTTNGSGNYLFSGLAAGNYTVVFPASISGAVVTNPNVGSDDNIDSDADQTTGATATITLAAGQNRTDVDAGYCPTTLELGNRVWLDANNDGLNSGEGGIANVTVRLYKDDNNDNVPDGAAIATLVTDADGFYQFTGLGPGNYIVGVVTPAGMASSSVNGGDPDNDINMDDNGQVIAGNETRGLAITLVAGTENDGTNTNTNINITYDFGFYPAPTGSIGDYVWGDADGDGIQDATETGLGGVTVQLFLDANNDCIADGAAVATTTTNASGFYQFTGLAAGNYLVQFPNIAGYFPSPANQGSDDTKDSDIDPNTGKVCGVSLAAGQNRTDIDAGYCPQTLALGDRVFLDTNNNGFREDAEVGIQGLTVRLYRDANNDNVADGAAIASTTTDANGFYRFDGLLPGNYIVGVAVPAGYTNSTGNGTVDPDNNLDRDDNGVNLVAGEIRGLAITLTGGGENLESGNYNNTYDFGFYKTLCAGNFVWNDANNNGLQDVGETGIGNVTVRLYADANNDNVPDGAAIATTTTNPNGIYSFCDLNPGNYIVGVVRPAGYMSSTTNGGDPDADADNNDDNGVNATTGQFEIRSNAVNLTVDGEPDVAADGDGTFSNATVDFGFYPLGRIGDFVWLDANGNGLQDAGEDGVAGVTVTLYDASNNAIATVVTDGEGFYSFNNLDAGTYTVGFTLPPDFVFTTRDAGDDTKDSDVNVSTGRTGSITLGVGQVNTTIDAGIRQTVNNNASVGDRVWNDVNNNGIQDPGELGVSGVTVTLRNAATNAVIGTQNTDALGNYLFTGLTPGTYYLVFGKPAGYNFSPQDASSNDEADSDVNPANGVTAPFMLLSGEMNLSFDAGINKPGAPTGCIGDFVWIDEDNDGIQDADEVGRNGITVVLYDASDNVVATTVTGRDGTYQFCGLAPGNYTVGFSNLPPFYAVSPRDNNPGNDNNDSDMDPVTGRTGIITLGAGQIRSDVDAGIVPPPGAPIPAAIGDRVWYDVNSNGIEDIGERGVPGVLVTLYDNTGTAIAITTTDADGIYEFTSIDPGTYSIGFSNLPTGHSITGQNLGGVEALDSDADPVTGRTNTVVLGPGDFYRDLDGGVRPATACLGGAVWVDNDKNGQYAISELLRNGVTVTLYNGTTNAQVGTPITTGTDGTYLFSNLAPGSYYVRFTTIPSGFFLVAADQGGNDNIDSDANNIAGANYGRSQTVTLAAGDCNKTVWAGISNSTVPVTVVNFKASLGNNKVAKLSWTAVNELNIEWYYLERSLDGQNFTQIAAIAARGNATSIDYNYNDDLNAVSASVVYYRVKIIDRSGSKYTDVLPVRLSGGKVSGITIGPNPAVSFVNVRIVLAKDAQTTIRITDMNGKTVVLRNDKLVAGTNTIAINNLSGLTNGTYAVQIIAGEEIFTERLVIRK